MPELPSATKRIDNGTTLEVLGGKSPGMRLVLFVAESLFLGYCGWLLIFRTSTIAGRAHKTYGYQFFLRPWYLIVIRCIGIFLWLLAAGADYAMLTLR